MVIPTILIVLGALVIAFIVIVATRSPEFRIARSATISAPPAIVFKQVNDFHNWNHWSPWAKIDPQMKQTFEGPPAGAGAIYTWVGNKKVGEGRMTILQSLPNELVSLKLEFMKPFKATNNAEFTFKPQNNQTVVTWAMTGKKNFMFKAVHMMMNMDKMLGGEFEEGLAQMKSVAENTRSN